MKTYKVYLEREAEKFLKKITKRDKPLYQRISRALEVLIQDPFIGKALSGDLKGIYSYRVGSYRIIYLIQSGQLIVLVVDIGHRKEVYKSARPNLSQYQVQEPKRK